MLATPNSSDYISVRSRTRDSSMSPSCRASVHHNTPPRPTEQRSNSYDSPMLTPSPLRRQSLFPYDHSKARDEDDSDDNDIFLQSPYKSPPHQYYSHGSKPPRPMQTEDDEGGIFLSTSAATQLSPFSPFPASTSQPLRTPVKQVHRTTSHLYHSVKHSSAQPHPITTASNSAFGVGTKRKSTPLGGSSGDFSTPLRQRVVTPLGVSSAHNAGDLSSESGGVAFDRLAPLPAPRFNVRTPQSKAETEVHLKKHTESMTHLRICDLDDSDGEGGGALFSSLSRSAGTDGKPKSKSHMKGKGKSASLGRTMAASILSAMAKKGRGKDGEVAESISPGGHITKRRARSRPVSQELLESVNCTPSPSPSQVDMANARARADRTAGPISFPSLHEMRSRAGSNSPESPLSPSEAGSPLPRRRVSGATNLSTQSRPSAFSNMSPPPESSIPVRAPMARLTSSATLFFGPAIPSPKSSSTNLNSRDRSRSRSRTRTSNGSPGLIVDTNVATRRPTRPPMASRPSLVNRHSYAGPNSGGRVASPLPWGHGLRGSGSHSPSPRSSPRGGMCFSDGGETQSFEDDDDDMFFDGPKDSSFIFSVTEGTPSPRKPSGTVGASALMKKYKPRDSGVVMSDDEGPSISGMGTIGASSSVGGAGQGYLDVMPRASTSVNSVSSDMDQELVTPMFGPGDSSGWPEAAIISGFGFDDAREGEGTGGEADVNAFILRTLAAATKPKERRESEGGYGTKKVPGTPVKKNKTTHLGNGERPWQSAVAAKVDYDFGLDLPKGKAAPRKSMPAAFPFKGDDSDSEGEDDSPSFRRDARYEGLGLGKPGLGAAAPSGPFARTRWLMRRSSSGMFSTGSDSSVGTPTKPTAEWNVPTSRIPTHLSPAKNAAKLTERSISGSSSSSVSTLYSPSTRRQSHVSGTPKPLRRPQASPIQQRPDSAAGHVPGRFEQDFVEDDEVGSGEFGKVMKVRYKVGHEGEVFAVKKSKKFEGIRHRLRLREEVDILQHLSQAAANGAGGQHPNVLAYVDSWEQDEALYIQTELCELGNFARFLWEYGRVFPRLDEARVWKIFVDLSTGLEFIHDSGVIHLDLKPANIFVTGEGRFKIGDFGMASLWPRPNYKPVGSFEGGGAFEREGDKVYLAPEVLQGKYGKAADIFSLGITMLETASNIVVPDQGDAWHQLRQEDFSQIDLDGSPELLRLIKSMMRTDPALRIDMQSICAHPVISRAKLLMDRKYENAKANGTSLFPASPLASVPNTFLDEILGRPRDDDGAMDLSP